MLWNINHDCFQNCDFSRRAFAITCFQHARTLRHCYESGQRRRSANTQSGATRHQVCWRPPFTTTCGTHFLKKTPSHSVMMRLGHIFLWVSSPDQHSIAALTCLCETCRHTVACNIYQFCSCAMTFPCMWQPAIIHVPPTLAQHAIPFANKARTHFRSTAQLH